MGALVTFLLEDDLDDPDVGGAAAHVGFQGLVGGAMEGVNAIVEVCRMGDAGFEEALRGNVLHEDCNLPSFVLDIGQGVQAINSKACSNPYNQEERGAKVVKCM